MKVVFASNNLDKLKELKPSFDFEIILQQKFEIPQLEETGLTFIENALLKARHACIYTGLPALADDSGLEVDALSGLPGIYSARFAGKNATSKQNIDKLLSELSGIETEKRTARFHCCLVYMRTEKDPAPLISHGILKGKILHEPMGENGFGYDPIFFIETMHCSAAQLSPEQKNHISHRGQAIKNLIKHFHIDQQNVSNDRSARQLFEDISAK
jgi:XTP/dITP diphosphohydrolase